MPSLSRELRNFQNPALGGMLLWRYACAYTEEHSTRDASPLHLAFLVLPLLYFEDTLSLLQSTQARSGLHGFAAKFPAAGSQSAEVLLALTARSRGLRSTTWHSLGLAVQSSLLTIAPKQAELVPLSRSTTTSIPRSLRSTVSASEKLGKWFARVTQFEVSNLLKVRL